MATKWDLNELNRQITDRIEESQTLDYKCAEALARTDVKQKEIRKDVSAMANAAGGVLVYGMCEFKDHERKHLPERLDPIDRAEFSREWLQDIINGIRPRISGLLIHPVPVSEDPPRVVYVVEVPESTTAHQASDLKYYRRYNFQSQPMYDHEIRDVMNRATWPDATPYFGSAPYKDRDDQTVSYALRVGVRNSGTKVIEHFMFEFTVPAMAINLQRSAAIPDTSVLSAPTTFKSEAGGSLYVRVRSQFALLPNEFVDLTQELLLTYDITPIVRLRYNPDIVGSGIGIVWRLLADNMPPKKGHVPFFPDLDHPSRPWPP